MKSVSAFACVLGALWLSGCFVPERHYDQAVHTLRAEQAAHRQTSNDLYGVQRKLAQANALLDKERAALEVRQNELAQSKFDFDAVTTERQDAAQMVDQLRSELARAGDHLRVFSDQKSELASALETAEGRADELRRLEDDFSQKALLMRDLTRALHGEMDAKTAAVNAASGEIRVRLDSKALFDGAVVLPDSLDTLRRIAAVVGPASRARIEITEHPEDSAYQPEDVVVRLQSLADVLSEGGVPFERVTLALPKERSAAEPTSGEPTEHREVDETDGAKEPKAAPPPPKAQKPGTSWVDGPGSVELAIRCAPEPETAAVALEKRAQP